MRWFEIEDTQNIITPAICLYVDRIAENIDKMIEIAGVPNRLRPHVKTYKMPEIVQMQMAKGIEKFKCATLSEAEMLAQAGAKDILLAMPLVGASQKGLLGLIDKFPGIRFSTLIDHTEQIIQWEKNLNSDGEIAVFLDVNVGMDRTGVLPGEAFQLVQQLQSEKNFHLKGIHVYDGHIREGDPEKRAEICDQAFNRIIPLLNRINQPNLEIVCGGSVTFPIHAKDENRILSPGTTLLWDAGYATNFPDIPMKNAAVLLTRVISKPAKNKICLDLGHKSVASEMQGKRIQLFDIANAKRVGHSEEHLVLELESSDQIEVGKLLYAIPWHICPTVALHENAFIVQNNNIVDEWKVLARHRKYLA